VASNDPVERKATLTDPPLCAAVVDRLAFKAHLVESGTASHRFAKAQENRRARRR
jgi:hypothetical protein